MTAQDRTPRLDRESAQALQAFLQGAGEADTLAERRSAYELAGLEESRRHSPGLAVEAEDLMTPEAYGPVVPLRSYRPSNISEPLPAILWIHGGGMIMGSIETDDLAARRLSLDLNVAVYSVGYRLAPEDPYPAGLDDCVAAARFIRGEAAALHVDANRLAVFGGSAGGGLAIALALRLRDEGDELPSLVLAAYPMISDSHASASAHQLPDIGVWDQAHNREAWGMYLQGREADQYAAPSRTVDLAGLPPIFMDVGDHDLFRDEVLDFARRLTVAGVQTEFHLYPGAFHASEEIAPEADLSRRILRARREALTRALDLPRDTAAPSNDQTRSGDHD